jgi:RecA-family ATPase
VSVAEFVDINARRPTMDVVKGDVERWVGIEPPPTVWTIDQLVPEGCVTVVGGDGGAGKGILLQTAATCIAGRVPFLGISTRWGAAVYVTAEDPDSALHGRQVRINKALGVRMEDLAGRLFIRSMDDQDVFLFSDGKPTRLAQAFEDELYAIPELRMVVIDSATLVFDDEEISRRRVGAFVRDLNRRAKRLTASFALVCHTSKSGDDSARGAFSGSTSWIWQARAALLLKAQNGDDATSLTLIKSNYARPGAKLEMVWTDDGVLLAAPEASSLEVQAAKRRIEAAIREAVDAAWRRDNPLSSAHQSSARYLPKVMARDGFRAVDLKLVMEDMLQRGTLKMDQRMTRTPRGLRIVESTSGVEDGP